MIDEKHKSRAEYFRERRKVKRQLVFMVDPEKADALDKKLSERGEGRTEWFRRKLDEEIGHGGGGGGYGYTDRFGVQHLFRDIENR